MSKNKYARGFTLIEIMVVVVILGILAAIVVPKIMSRPEEAKLVKAREDIMAIEESLDLYKLDNGNYPTTDQGLQALVNKPTTAPIPLRWRSEGYVKNIPLDPWQHPYQYLSPGQHGEIDVFSSGNPSLAKNGDATIGNWTVS